MAATLPSEYAAITIIERLPYYYNSNLKDLPTIFSQTW